MLHRIWNTFGIIVIVIGLALVVAFVGVRAFELTPYAVLSGSMEPRYPTGSLIYVQHATPADVAAGDAITFRLDSGTLVTHEVYDVDEARQQFLTQGIANKNADGSTLHDAAPVPFTALVGKPVAALPLLGYVNVACTTPPGIFVIIAALGVFIGTSLIIGRAKTRPSPRKELHVETTINKKRIALIAALAACLAAAAVAGVLAWLTVSNSVTNTFTIGSITQPTTDPDIPGTTVTLAGNISENKWVADSKIVPGSTVAKNPNIGIGKGSDSSYVYAFVKNNVATDAYFTLNSNWQPVTYAGEGSAKPLAGGSAGEYTGGLFVYVGPSGSDAAVLAGSPTADAYTGELFSAVKMPTTATAASYTGKDGAYTMDVSCYLATSEGTSTIDLATAVQTWADGLAA